MSANSFGQTFKVTSFGESHGAAYGAIIDGCPAGLKFDIELLKTQLLRRRPGQSGITTSRNELDEPEILSGVFDGKTLGTPICIVVKNSDQRSNDYEEIKKNPRPGHADDVWKAKFGHSDHRGGGRASGRETLVRVIAGAVAQMLCGAWAPQMKINAFTSQISDIALDPFEVSLAQITEADNFETRFPSSLLNDKAVALLKAAKEQGESYGGRVSCRITSAPMGLGQPVFHKLKSDLASAVMSIGATVGFEFGSGFSAVGMAGTKMHSSVQSIHYGGIRGGISTGEDINFNVAFKPTSSINDTAKKGRHDPCIVPRAVPVVEAMAWIVLADHLLMAKLDRV